MGRACFGRACFGLVGLVVCLGCDTSPRMNYGAVELVEASGTVTLDGEPLPGAVVTFEADDGQFSSGLTDANGDYELQFDSEAAGVRPGLKTVRISTTRKILGLNTEEEDEGGEPSANAAVPEERVPEKYNRRSELSVEVTPDRTRYDFDLTSH